MAVVFAVLAVPPLLTLLREASDPAFGIGFSSAQLLLAGVILSATGGVWLMRSRLPDRIGPLLIVGGSLFGLYVGAYGLWGASVLNDACRYVSEVAVIASSWPEGFCGSENHNSSLSVMYYMVGVGMAALVSMVALWWLSRKAADPALD